MKLLIVESPNKKQTIAKYLGPGWRVEASMGHICDLPLKKIGVSSPDYHPKYELTERGKQTITRLKDNAKNAESVWLAMDPDREGEAIAGHLERYLKKSASVFYRVVFNEITEKAIRAAVDNPRKLNKDLFDAQQARRVIDRLVGYKVSPRLSQAANQKLSAGRVQSVAVRFLVERERAIRNFKPTEHFGFRLHFNTKGIEWFANLDTEPFVNEECPYLLDRSLVEQLSDIKEVIVLSVEKKASLRKAPPPFITTTLQKAASIQLGCNAEETMRLAQTLFEKGLISYHRTDNPNLSEEAIIQIQDELERLELGERIVKPKNEWKAKAGAQEAHEAIRPTEIALLDTGLEQKVQRLYEMIRVRALACQLQAAKLQTTTITLVPLEEKFDLNSVTPRFVAKGVQIVYSGWQILVMQDLAEDNSKDEFSQVKLPALKVKEELGVDKSEVLELKTQPPKRYTEPSLITKLEKEGIGRPSTYAAILSNIQQRDYVRLKGKVFEAMPSAETIYDTLVEKFQFMEVAYTRLMESALDEIADGKQEYFKVVSKIDISLQEGLNNLLSKESQGINCPQCQAPMRKIKGKHGDFLGCSRYTQGCKGTLKIVEGI